MDIMKSIRKDFLSKIIFFISILVALILSNTIVTWYSSRQITISNQKKQSILQLRAAIDDIESTLLRGVDLGVRGYGITRSKQLLGPYSSTILLTDTVFKDIYLHSAGFDIDMNEVRRIEEMIHDYNDYITYLVSLIDDNKLNEFRDELYLDKGLGVWTEYNEFKIRTYEILHEEELKLNRRVTLGNQIIIFIQLLTFLVALPLLYYLYIQIKKYRKQKKHALLRMEEYNARLENYTDLMSHTIRSPICTLKGLLMLIEKSEDGERTEILKKIAELTEKIDDITRLENFDEVG